MKTNKAKKMFISTATKQFILALFTFLILGVSCKSKPEPTPEIAQETLAEFDYLVALDDTPHIEASGSDFQVTTDNCGSRVSTIDTFTRSRSFNVTMSAEISEAVRGQLGNELTLGEIEAQVGLKLGLQIGGVEMVERKKEIETPADSIKTVTLRWQEIWQIGHVSIQDRNGRLLGTIPFRVLTTLDLAQVDVDESPCNTFSASPTLPNNSADNQKVDAPEATATPLPTYTPYPTYTPLPTNTSQPTPQPTQPPAIQPTAAPPTVPPAPQNTGLTVGQWYTEGNVSLGLTEVHLLTSPLMKVGLVVPVRNVSNNTISIQYGSYNFLLKDNLGNTYAPSGSSTQQLVLDAGETERFLTPGLCCKIFFPVDYTNPQITQFTFIVQDFSSVAYAEWVIPVYH